MRTFRQVVELVRWDILRETRRRDVLLNMTLFAVLILFAGQAGVAVFAKFLRPDPAATAAEHAVLVGQASDVLGPIFFWIAALFAGTVGLGQSFAAEREGGAIGGIITAPLDKGLFYLAKVACTWLYVMAMQVILFVAYVVLFNYAPGEQSWLLVGAVGAFSLAYVAPGVVLAAMTTSLRGGGEVVLRILLFVLMVPLILLTLEVSPELFGVRQGTEARGGALGDFGPGNYIAIALGFSAVYLSTGFILFPKVLEE